MSARDRSISVRELQEQKVGRVREDIRDAGTLSQVILPVGGGGGGGGGGGDVVGPASSVDNAVVLFSGATGKLIKDSGLLVADLSTGGGTATGTNTGDQTLAGLGGVPTSRTISTTAPLTGGGDLTANRTLAISAATTGAAGSMSAADKTKLDGVAAGATANSTDAQLRDRSTHTGTQGAGTITGLAAVATSGAKADVGLGNVDNTSDADKPVSTAQQTALDGKLDDSQASAFGLSLLDDADAATARSTLGLGTAATTAASDYATAAQGAKADSALQPADVPTLANGAYTPTATPILNVASVTPFEAQYMRVGDVVTVSGRVQVTASANSAITVFRMSVPIASAFTGPTAHYAGGVGTIDVAQSGMSPVSIRGITTDLVNFRYTCGTTGTTAHDIYYSYTYRIV